MLKLTAGAAGGAPARARTHFLSALAFDRATMPPRLQKQKDREWTLADYVDYFEENDAVTDYVRKVLECLDEDDLQLDEDELKLRFGSGSAGSSGLDRLEMQPPPPPTAPGAHDAGIDYGEIAPDIAADNMAAHIAAKADNMPPPPPAGSGELEPPRLIFEDPMWTGGEVAPTTNRRGGAHDKQTMWTGEESLLLIEVVKSGAYTEKGKIQWKKLTIEHLPTRNDAAVRNHYLRIEKATKEREREDGDKKRNKCRKCGQIKFGHRCTGSQPAAAAARAAGSGSGGSAAGSSAGGKLLRAAGLKVIASARIVKRFNHFKSVKLHTVLDSIVQGDPLDDDHNIAVRGWAAQCFPHGLAPSDSYPPNGRPRALTRAVTESLDASFEAYVKSIGDGGSGEGGGDGGGDVGGDSGGGEGN